MRPPLAAPLAAVSGGVFAARFADFSTFDILACGLCAAMLALLGLRAPRAAAGEAACLLALGLAGAWLADVPDVRRPCAAPDVLERLAIDPGEPVRLRGWVRRPAEAMADADRFDLTLEAVLDTVPACETVRVTVQRELEDPPLRIAYGTRVELLARLRTPRNYRTPGAFDRVGYLRKHGIVLNASVRRYAPILPLEGAGGETTDAWLWELRGRLRERFDALALRAELPAEETALLRAMLLGDRSGLSEATKSAFERSGSYHALVVSGLHVGVAAAAIFGLFRLCGAPRWSGAAAAAAFAGSYAALLEGATPVSRAAWMLGAYLTAALVFRQRRPLNVICAVALGFLLWQPRLLFDAGFQLSFLSVACIAGIALPILSRTTEPRRQALRDIWNTDLDLHLPIEAAERRVATRAWLEPLLGAVRLRREPATWCATRALRAGWGAVALAIVSTVLVVALAVPMSWHFHRIAGAGPLTNMLTVPLVGVAAPAGLAALATNRPEALRVAAWAAAGMRRAAEWGAGVRGGERRVPPPPAWLAAAAGLSLLGWAAGLARGGRAAWLATACAFAVFLAVRAHPFPAAVERGKLELTAIDVGQGEALLLGLPDGSAALIDAGGLPDFGDAPPTFDVGEEVVSPYLWSRSIQWLRALVVTHPDGDHMGGAAAVLRNFQVDELWLGRGTFRGEYAALAGLAGELGTRVVRLGAGDVRELGGVEVQVLHPVAGTELERNDLSLALLVRHGEHELLLTGDVEEAGEALLTGRLGAFDGEILKVSHHGSRTSSSAELLERFRPEIAVISAGPENLYGHPHAEALQRLEGMLVLRTDRQGTVGVLSDGERLEVR